MRTGRVAVANDPGADALQAPGLAAFVPGLARHLLCEDALMAGVETLHQRCEEGAKRREPCVMRV